MLAEVLRDLLIGIPDFVYRLLRCREISVNGPLIRATLKSCLSFVAITLIKSSFLLISSHSHSCQLSAKRIQRGSAQMHRSLFHLVSLLLFCTFFSHLAQAQGGTGAITGS